MRDEGRDHASGKSVRLAREETRLERVEVGAGGEAQIQIVDDAVADVIDPAVDLNGLAAIPSLAKDGRLADVDDLFHDVEFAEARVAAGFVGERVNLATVFYAHVLNVAEPVVNQAEFVIAQSREDAAAAIVAADNDVLDLENFDGVLKDRQAIEVAMDDDVSDVAMDEKFAGGEADDIVGGDAAVGATDPEIAGGLLAFEAIEKARVLTQFGCGPCAVIVEEVFDGNHGAYIVRAGEGWSRVQMGICSLESWQESHF